MKWFFNKKSATTHDYTARHWGHDYTITKVYDNGQMLDVMGWDGGVEIKKGDFIILCNGTSSSRYKVASIRYFDEPKDMWSMKAEFVPRSEPQATLP